MGITVKSPGSRVRKCLRICYVVNRNAAAATTAGQQVVSSASLRTDCAVSGQTAGRNEN